MSNFSTFFETFKIAINSIWPMITLFVVIILLSRISYIIIHHDRFIFYKEFFWLVAIIYFLLLYYLLLSTDNASSGINISLFREITRYKVNSRAFYYNVLGNIFLFIPFGFLISSYLKNKKTFVFTLIISLATSLTAELIQFKIGRAFDVLLNVLGAVIGYYIYFIIASIKRILPDFLKREWFYNIISIIVLILVILLFYFFWGKV